MDDWYQIARRARWATIVDVKRSFPQADAVGKTMVFNVGGNKYRLVVEINYRRGKVYILRSSTANQRSAKPKPGD